MAIPDEGPNETPSQIDDEDIAKPYVGGLQKYLTAIGYAQFLVIEDSSTDGGQTKNANEVDPMKPARGRVPYSISLEAWRRHLPDTLLDRSKLAAFRYGSC